VAESPRIATTTGSESNEGYAIQYRDAAGSPQVTTDSRSAGVGPLAALADLLPDRPRAVEATVEGVVESLILLRVGEAARAYLNVCPHAGRRLDWAPGEFLVDAGRLVCAAHGACFEQASGLCSSGPCRGSSLVSVPVRVVDGMVWLDDAATRSG